jgi:broad specificity phosphatase PhoE
MKIYLTRHSQSTGNIDKSEYFRKLDCDIGLTEQGRHDSIKTADRIMDIHDIIVHKNDDDYSHESKNPPYKFNMYYSPYLRARQTANLIHGKISGTDGYNINEYKENPLLVERSWEGLRDIILAGKKTEDHFNFYYRSIGGESFADAYQRVVLFDMLLKSTSKYEHNIVVAHGEFNKLYLMHLLGWSVEEFKKWKTPRNGEVYLIDGGTLSNLTPLTEKIIKH